MCFDVSNPEIKGITTYLMYISGLCTHLSEPQIRQHGIGQPGPLVHVLNDSAAVFGHRLHTLLKTVVPETMCATKNKQYQSSTLHNLKRLPDTVVG